VSEFELGLRMEINEENEENGLPPLAEDEALPDWAKAPLEAERQRFLEAFPPFSDYGRECDWTVLKTAVKLDFLDAADYSSLNGFWLASAGVERRETYRAPPPPPPPEESEPEAEDEDYYDSEFDFE